MTSTRGRCHKRDDAAVHKCDTVNIAATSGIIGCQYISFRFSLRFYSKQKLLSILKVHILLGLAGKVR